MIVGLNGLVTMSPWSQCKEYKNILEYKSREYNSKYNTALMAESY